MTWLLPVACQTASLLTVNFQAYVTIVIPVLGRAPHGPLSILPCALLSSRHNHTIPHCSALICPASLLQPCYQACSTQRHPSIWKLLLDQSGCTGGVGLGRPTWPTRAGCFHAAGPLTPRRSLVATSTHLRGRSRLALRPEWLREATTRPQLPLRAPSTPPPPVPTPRPRASDRAPLKAPMVTSTSQRPACKA